MKSPLAFVAAIAVVAPVMAQTTDFMTAPKISCVPDRMTRCKSPGVECETRETSERDRAQPLVIDFAAKKAFISRDGKESAFADVTEDKVEGEARRVVLAPGQEARNALVFLLQKSGKMEGTREEGRIKMETTCKAVS